MIRLPSARQRAAAGRGQSEVLGVVLLVAVVVLGTTVVGLLGAQSMAASRGTAEVAQAEHALSELDRRASTVALDLEAETAEAPLSLGGREGTLRVRETGWLRVTLVNASTGVVDYEVVNVSPLGRVAFARDDTTVAVEGGGVWRSDRGHAVMLAPPEFHYRNGTLTLPIIATSGDAGLTDPVRLERDGPPDRRYPNQTAGYGNRLAEGKVRVTVQSPYYEAWGRYFDDETNGIVTYDHAARTATVTFLALPRTISLGQGIVATAGTGELALAGNGAYTDSYDSSVGPYSDTRAENGNVWAAGDVTMVGSSAVYGDVRSGDTVNLSGTSDVNGDVYWTNAFEPNGATVLGNDSQIAGVGTIEPIDGYVAAQVDAIATANDNANTTLVNGNRLDFDGATSGTLTAGTYYLTDLSLFGEELTLDTTDGNITIAVRDYVRVDRGGKGNAGGNLSVVGDNVVRVYVASEDEVTITTEMNNALDRDRDLNFYVSPDALVDVPEDRSTQLRVFGTSDFSMAIAANQGKPAAFYGLVYAPAGYAGTGEVYIKQAELAGAVITGQLTLGQYGAIHYDESIRHLDLPRSPTVSRLEYLHVAVHRLSVTS